MINWNNLNKVESYVEIQGFEVTWKAVCDVMLKEMKNYK